jgi:hypothetical protein
MMPDEPNPPRWADAILRSLVRPSDRETISGDLLEEFRAVQYPVRGALRANGWYLKHVFSILWRLIRPCVLTLVVMQVFFSVVLSRNPPDADGLTFLVFKSLWYGSPVQAPGISLFDALMYGWAAYRGARQSQLIRTGVLAGGVTSFVGFTGLFAAIAIGSPGLLLAPFSQPFIFIILFVLLSMALGCGILAGTLGGVVGRWTATIAPGERRAS